MNHKKLLGIVRGSNDIGSAVAHRLFTAGHTVVIHDSPAPAVSRRGMAFADAIFDGHAELGGVTAVRADDPTSWSELLDASQVVPVVVLEFSELLNRLHPDVIVDARMRKHDQPDSQIGQAPLTIGLGPNMTAGQSSDIVIETDQGPELGRVIYAGSTHLLRGEPKPIAGHSRDRYVYAPCDGLFSTGLHIGETVGAGQKVGQIGEFVLQAPLDGVLRGLVNDRVPVRTGTKMIEVDPRGSDAMVLGIGERPAKIADGVLCAIQAWLNSTGTPQR